MISLVYISFATKQYDIVSRLVTYRNKFHLMDPSQSEYPMKLQDSLEQKSLQYGTSVLIDLAATLSFACQISLNRNTMVGKCIRGPKIAVNNVHGQHDPKCFL